MTKHKLSENLLGRLRLKVIEDISSTNKLPSGPEVANFLKKKYGNHRPYYRFMLYLFNTDYNRQIDINAIPPVNISDLLASLEKNPLGKNYLFFEITNCPKELPPTIGVLIICEGLKGGGYVYSIYMMEESSFPEKFLSYFELRAARSQPEPFIITPVDGKMRKFSQSDFYKSFLNKILIRILSYLHYNPMNKNLFLLSELQNVKLSDLSKKIIPPNDKKFNLLIKRALKNEIPCYQAEVNLELLKPFDVDYCIDFPLDIIQEFAEKIREKYTFKILTYWHNNRFITSDDYSIYLAYKYLEYKKVIIIIMGEDFPINKVRILKKGKNELLPGIHLTSDERSSLSEEDKNKKLDHKLKELKQFEKFKLHEKNKFIILTEDTKTKPLSILLESSGFSVNEVQIYTYNGCKNVMSVKLLVDYIRSKGSLAEIIVHQDRDYNSSEGITILKNNLSAINIKLFITKGTDVESYYLIPRHINFLYPQISIKLADLMIKEAIECTKNLSIEYLKKANPLTNREILEELYHKNPVFFTHGKTTLNYLKKNLQKELKKNPDLFRSSPFIKCIELSSLNNSYN